MAKAKEFDRRQYCISLLRRGFLRCKLRMQCLAKARKRGVNPKTGRECYFIQCNICKKWFPQNQIKVDHIDPVTPVDMTKITLDKFAERLYCSIENLQNLCKEDHDAKTKRENALRKSARAARKSKDKSGTRRKYVSKDTGKRKQAARRKPKSTR